MAKLVLQGSGYECGAKGNGSEIVDKTFPDVGTKRTTDFPHFALIPLNEHGSELMAPFVNV